MWCLLYRRSVCLKVSHHDIVFSFRLPSNISKYDSCFHISTKISVPSICLVPLDYFLMEEGMNKHLEERNYITFLWLICFSIFQRRERKNPAWFIQGMLPYKSTKPRKRLETKQRLLGRIVIGKPTTQTWLNMIITFLSLFANLFIIISFVFLSYFHFKTQREEIFFILSSYCRRGGGCKAGHSTVEYSRVLLPIVAECQTRSTAWMS